MSGLESSSLHSATRRFSPPDSVGHVGAGRRAAQRVHRLFDLRFQIPQILRVDDVLEPRHLVGGLVGIVHRDLVVAVEHRLFLGDAFHRIAEDVLGRVELRLLRQIADLDALRRPGLARETPSPARP